MISKDFLAVLTLACFVFLAGLSAFSLAAGGLNCTISISCPGGFTKLLGLENDSGGLENAHVQNYSIGTYAYSLCCQTTDAGVSLNATCGETFLKLSAQTNAHIQQPSVDTYSVVACMNTDIARISCDYPTGSCSAGFECLGSMASSEGDNTTNAHLGNCSAYSTKICCGLNNTAPSQATLITPINAAQTTDRTPFFNWTDSTDADGDSITYRIQVSLDSGFSATVIDTQTSSSNYTQSTEMDFDQYFWRVYANDTLNWSLSTTENFTIITLINLTLVNRSVDFGQLSPEQQNGTEDDNPFPLKVRNDGNVEANVSINSTQLFSQASLGTDSFQYRAANSSELNSFSWSASTTAYANMQASPTQFMKLLNHTDSNDEGEIDIRIDVPGDEPAGEKNATVWITGEVS